MYPRYLAEVRGYSALMIGETMFVSGIAMFLTAPIVGRLMREVDMRYIIATGLVHLRARLLADDLDHPRLRFLRIAGAADPARHRHDVRDGADQHHRARDAAAGAGQERLGAVQPDAQSRRRGRARGHQPGAESSAPTCTSRGCTNGSTGATPPRPRRSTCSPSACRAWAMPR